MAELKGRCLCGSVEWTLSSPPESVNSCNCEACHRYGALWAYGTLGESVEVVGETRGFVREDVEACLAFHTCMKCGALVAWLPLVQEKGERCAVNLRMARLGEVESIPVRRFDGGGSWEFVEMGRVVLVGEVW